MWQCSDLGLVLVTTARGTFARAKQAHAPAAAPDLLRSRGEPVRLGIVHCDRSAIAAVVIATAFVAINSVFIVFSFLLLLIDADAVRLC